MDLTPPEADMLDAYLGPFLEVAGDRRTARLLGGTVRGIVGSGSLICAQIAACSPGAGRRSASREADPRMRRAATVGCRPGSRRCSAAHRTQPELRPDVSVAA